MVTADVLKLEIWQECYAQIDTERFGLCVCGEGVLKSQPAASSFVLLISFVFNQSSVSDIATVPTTKIQSKSDTRAFTYYQYSLYFITVTSLSIPFETWIRASASIFWRTEPFLYRTCLTLALCCAQRQQLHITFHSFHLHSYDLVSDFLWMTIWKTNALFRMAEFNNSNNIWALVCTHRGGQ